MNAARAVLVVATLFGGGAAAVACSSSEDSTAENPGGGGDASTADVRSAAEGGEADTGSATGPGAAACAAQETFDIRCNRGDDAGAACQTARKVECPERSSRVLSAVAVDTLAACGAAAPCATDAGAAIGIFDGLCSQQKLAAATPTSVQAQIAQTFCASTCGTRITDCGNEFYKVRLPGQGADGIGTYLLILHDDVARETATECLASLEAADAGTDPNCGYNYFLCTVIASDNYKPAPPTACK